MGLLVSFRHRAASNPNPHGIPRRPQDESRDPAKKQPARCWLALGRAEAAQKRRAANKDVTPHAPLRDVNRPRSAPAQAVASRTACRPGLAASGAHADCDRHGQEHQARSASAAEPEIVGEYMRRSVDPVMRELVTHLLVEKPSDVTKEMLSYLRGVRDGTTPQIQMDSQRKVSKEDRVYMARDVKPLLTDLLSDVVRARPRAPVDFSIAWLASRRAQATDVPLPNQCPKLRDAISFDAAVTSQKPTTTLEKKRIFVLGDSFKARRPS